VAKCKGADAATAIHLQRDFALWTESALKNVVRRIHSARRALRFCPYPRTKTTMRCIKRALYYLRLVGLEKKPPPGHDPQRRGEAEASHSQAAVQETQDPSPGRAGHHGLSSHKQEVLDAIKNVNKELGLTIIVVSHLPEIHEYLADRLLWLEKGRSSLKGSPGMF